jgi:hypothetical protein
MLILKAAWVHVEECTTHMRSQLPGAEVELEGGQKLSAKLVILGDGVHSKTANKYHKMALKTVDIAAWRYNILRCHLVLIISNVWTPGYTSPTHMSNALQEIEVIRAYSPAGRAFRFGDAPVALVS